MACVRASLLVAWVACVASFAPPRGPVARRCIRVAGELGERTSVSVIQGAQPKKLRKKVRRSRSPLLYPAKTSGGSDCFLQLTSEQAHIAKSEFPVSAFVSRVISRDGEEPQGEGVSSDDGVLVMTPTPAEVRSRAPVAAQGGDDKAGAPSGPPGRLLKELRANDKVEAVVLRHIAPDVALVAVSGIFRASKNGGFRRQSAALPGGGALAIGDAVECYVTLSEPNSGRLTVSLDPVDVGTAKRRKQALRLRKQVKRGSLREGAVRVATVVGHDGAELRVDAGGLQGAVAPAADEGPFAPGDRVMVRVARFDAKTLAAALEYVAVDELPADAADDGNADAE